jgi:predicted phosphodiesterase
MNILVFSDSHLSLPFEEKKYNFLHNLISQSDRVIINGDFWEGYVIPFQKFIDSAWSNLFPLLLSKNTIYIFGNHDNETFSNNKLSLFSVDQVKKHTLKLKDKTLIFEHGNRLYPFGDEGKIHIDNIPQKETVYADILEKIIIRSFGSTYQKMFKRFNTSIKNKLRSERINGEYYVVGHTHCAEVDHENKFINTGIIKHGLAQYLLIKNDVLYPKQEKYL